MVLSVRKRFRILGCIATVAGLVHLGIFFTQVAKDESIEHTKKSILLQPGALSHLTSFKTVGNISQHLSVNTDTKSGHDKHDDAVKYRIIEKVNEDSTKATNDVTCKGDWCGIDFKIKSKPGELEFNTSEEVESSSTNLQYSFTPESLKIAVITDKATPNNTYFHPHHTILNPLPKKIILHNPDLCSLENGKPPYLLVLVPTVADHVLDRRTIRDTWGSAAYNGGRWANTTLQQPVRILFILGSSKFTDLDMAVLTQEARDHGDLLLSDFVDSYRNLSLKVAVGLAWSQQYCQGANHVVKVDEDTFMFLPKLLALLQRTDLQYRKYIMGFPHNRAAPAVLRKGKWRVDPKLYPYDSYPRYVYGHSYVISGQSVKNILGAYLRMPFINNEDALFTGILPVVTDTVRLSHRSFAYVGRHEEECRVVDGGYVSLTSCCKIHHKTIFNAIKNKLCHTYLINQLREPGCKFNPRLIKTVQTIFNKPKNETGK